MDGVEVVHASAAFARFAERFEMPVVASFRRASVFDGEHDLGVRAKQVVREAWSGGEATTA